MSRRRRQKSENIQRMEENIVEDKILEEDENLEEKLYEEDEYDDDDINDDESYDDDLDEADESYDDEDLEYIEEDDEGNFLPPKKGRRRHYKRKEKKKHSKKKIIIVIVVLLFIIAIAIFVASKFLGGNDSNSVYVEQVSQLMGLGSSDGTIGRYAGVVESQKTTDVKSDSNMSVSKVKVSAGQEVKKGTTLFTYDLTSIKEQLAQKQLEYDQKSADIEDSQANIKEYTSSRASVKTEREKLSYTIQIKEEENTIKSVQYQQKSLKKEIDSLKKASKNRKVKSKLAGIVKAVKKSDGSDVADGDSSSSSTQVTVTIMATGSYRIKAKVNEQNVSDVENAQNMLVYSRVDAEKFWKGSKTTIDYDGTMASGTQTDDSSDTTLDSGSDMSEDDTSSDETTTSTSYTFYVDLDTTDGLLLGQHVYVEADNGQSSVKDGVWLESYYICDVDSNPYVWTEKNGKLVKASVTLGDYDEDLDEYEIKVGLTREDYITFPMDELKEGTKVEHASAEDMEDGSDEIPEDDTSEAVELEEE